MEKRDCSLSMCGRRSGLVVSELDSGLRGPGSALTGSLCCVLGQNTLLSQCLSPPRSINWYQQTVRETRQNAGRLPAMD